MPDISTNSSIEEYLAAFKDATFGEDVRDALIAAINLCYRDIVKAVWQMKKGDSITNATIQDGHLILTITDNETQESRTVDAGVVKGDKGDQGPKGDPGDTGPEHEWNVDGSFSQTSVNPIQNRIITAKLNEIITDKLNKSAVDSSLSLSSTNPVQNKIITARLNEIITAKVNKLSIDTDYVLISNGTGGMKNSTKKIGDASALHSENDSDYLALESAVKQYSYSRSDSNQRFVAWAQVDDELDEESENPVQNKAIATKIAEIENNYSAPDATIDITSTKPIQNRAVAQALNEKVDSDDFSDTIFDDIDLVFSSTNGGIYYNGNSPSQVPALFVEGAGTDPDFTYYLSYIDSVDMEIHRVANITSLVDKVIKIDTELNENSTNPVQNKVITDALNSKMTATEITGQPSAAEIAKYTDPKTLYMFYCGISGINDYVSMIFISSNEEAETPGGETLYPNSTQFAIAASTGKIYTRTADEDGYFGDFHDDVGDLDDLPTTDKSSLVAAVSETFTSVSNGKAVVASAITDKGVQTSSDATFSEMAQNIENIPSGGGVKEKTVNFYNYTGELVHSYTADEIAELTELPEAPTVQGMTFQTWNWNLADIKSWVQNHDEGSLPVGAVFVTDDGHTRIYMHLREPKMASKEMPFCIQQMTGNVTIDWGDNSQPETITAAGIYSHLWKVSSYPADVMINIEYAPSGGAKLVLGRADGSTTYGLFNNEIYYASCVEKVEYGTNTDMLFYSATFKNCSKLKSINIPSSFTSIGIYAFQNCTNLALTVLPDGITSIGIYAFQNCTNLALTVLPDSITSIDGGAFSGCTNLALTVLPDSITSIDDGAFNGCTNLALTVLPDGIISIGAYAFNGCTNLALTVLPDGITRIDSYAFSGCTNLALTVLPDGITSIGIYAFQNCTNLALTVLPDSITSIDDGAFNGCTNLALTVLPDSITSIDGGAFQNCTNLALTVLPDSITSIGAYAFNGCTNLALTVLPDRIISIDNGAFSGCTNLALTVLPDRIISIGAYAFNGCTNLALTVLPDGITSIDNGAFQDCTSLYFIDLTAFIDPQAIPTLANANAFSNIPATAQFIVANQEMYDAFTTATNWRTYASKFVIEGA